MEFDIPGYDDLVWDVSLVCDRIGNSTQHGGQGEEGCRRSRIVGVSPGLARDENPGP